MPHVLCGKEALNKEFLIVLLDNSIEILNLSFTLRDFEFIVNAIELISKPKKIIILNFHY